MTCEKHDKRGLPGRGCPECDPDPLGSKSVSNDLLSRMSTADIEAAKRFHETIIDDGTYDISSTMCERLVDLGLATNPDVDFYYETDLMLSLIDALER